MNKDYDKIKHKEYNLFNEILTLIDTYCDEDIRDINRNDFIDNVHGKWSQSYAYPRMASISNASIVVVWSDEFRDRYPRHRKKK